MAVANASGSQVSPNSLAERIGFLLNSSQWTDFAFYVGSENVQVFNVHKIILAASSPVFEAMLFGPLAEQNCVNVPDLEPNIFEYVLKYIYTDKLKVRSTAEACGVLYAAKKYIMPHLSALCREYIKNNVRPSNVLYIIEFAEYYEESELIAPCVEVLSKNTEEILQSSMSHISSTTLTTILQQNTLNFDEMKLFQSVLNWAEEECELRGVLSTPENCRSVLLEIGALSKIRFLALTNKQFAEGPEKSGILTSEEIQILRLAMIDLKNKTLETKILSDIGNSRSTHQNFSLNRSGNESVNSDSSVSKSIKKSLASYELSCISNPRNRVLVKQFYCGRRFLKTSLTVSGPLKLLSKIQVDKNIFVCGIRYFTRLIPQYEFSRFEPVRQDYKEQMELYILDDEDTELYKMEFTEHVFYNTIGTATLSDTVRFMKNKEYRILLTIPSTDGYMHEYPLGILSQVEDCYNVGMHFSDYADVNDSGNFVSRIDVGFVNGLVFVL